MDPARQQYEDAKIQARAYSKSLEGPSLAERIAKLPADQRASILNGLSTLDLSDLRYNWEFWARPKQDPPNLPPHRILAWLGGRSSGKTRAAIERIKKRVYGGARSIAILGPTLKHIHRTQIFGEGGADGLLTVFPREHRPEYNEQKGIIHFHTGAVAIVETAEKPEFRGTNLDTVWCDELSVWRYLDAIWNNIELSLRYPGELPIEIIISMTPQKRKLLREIIADPETVTILLETRENRAVDAGFIKRQYRRLGGTRLGQQELSGEILDDVEGALFHSADLERARVEEPPPLDEIVVAIDPAISTRANVDPTSIVVMGRGPFIDPDTGKREDGHLYVLAEITDVMPPRVWAEKAIKAFAQYGATSYVVERNRGGDLVENTLRMTREIESGPTAAASMKILEVQATRGKEIRAEPVSVLSEKGWLHIVGVLPDLETEITEWDPSLGGRSPNRLDAMVWGAYHLGKLNNEEEPKKDFAPGFKGLAQATKRLRPNSGMSPLVRAGRGDEWGSKL